MYCTPFFLSPQTFPASVVRLTISTKDKCLSRRENLLPLLPSRKSAQFSKHRNLIQVCPTFLLTSSRQAEPSKFGSLTAAIISTPFACDVHKTHIMNGSGKKTLNSEEMLAEARAFQMELNRTTDRRGGRTLNNMASPGRGSGGMSSPVSGAYGSVDRNAVRTPRAASGQPVVQKLATPEQLFGLPKHLSASSPRNTPTPVTQQPAARPVDNFEPMQVDPHLGMPQVNKTAAEGTGPGLVSSRWATSGTPKIVSHTKPVSGFEGMEVDTDSHVPKHASESNKPLYATDQGAQCADISTSTPAPAAHTIIAKDTGNAGVTMYKGNGLHSSSSQATLDTPEASSGSKGLQGSRWALATPSTPKYPDPSTLEPVYRSKNWLADLAEENKAESVKTKHAAETQPIRSNPAIQPAGPQTAALAMKNPVIGTQGQSQHFGQTNSNFPAASQPDTTTQPASRRVASHADPQSQTFERRVMSPPAGPTEGPAGLHQQQNTNASPFVDPSRAPISAQAASDKPRAPTTNIAPGGIFNDTSFKDWYNSQFMRRKA